MLQFDTLLNMLLLACCLHLLWLRHRAKFKRWLKYNQDRLPRQWHPKSPHDCHACCQHLQLSSVAVNHDVEPYAKRKSTRGRHKSVSSQGIACLNLSCDYFGITDQHIHALVSHGKRGQHRDIQYFRCQACSKAFSSRKGTPLYYLKTPVDTVDMVLWFLAEGVDRSVLVRYTGHPDSTIARWLTRIGEHSQGLHNLGNCSKLFDVLKANGFNPTIQTAFIERVNLSIRQGVSLLTRRTWSTARSEDYLLMHVEWWRAYYHFVRPHESLQGQTPAMKLGLTDHIWSVRDLLMTPLIPSSAVTSGST